MESRGENEEIRKEGIDPDANPLTSIHDEDFTESLIEGICGTKPKVQTENNKAESELNSNEELEESKQTRSRRRRRGIC